MVLQSRAMLRRYSYIALIPASPAAMTNGLVAAVPESDPRRSSALETNAVYSFAGVESLAMAAAETKNPRQNIPKACKRVFARPESDPRRSSALETNIPTTSTAAR
jgi:hypothetical protein